MKKVGLICVTRDNAEGLRRTIHSILSQTQSEKYDLFIIDNASSDGTLRLYQGLPPEQITIVRSGKNLEWSQGINLGLRMTADYEFIGFLSDDLEVCPNWLEHFLEVLEFNPAIAAVGPLTSNPREWQNYDRVCSFFDLPPLQGIDRDNVAAMYEHTAKNGIGRPIPQMLGFFCVLLRRSVIDRTGLLDGVFAGLYSGGDEDYFSRISAHGMQMAVSFRTFVAQRANPPRPQLPNFRPSSGENTEISGGNITPTVAPVAKKPDLDISRIWVINLERRKDRLEKFQAAHPELSKEASVLRAYDGKNLRLTPSLARLFAPNDFGWNKATMGCSLSHLELWLKLAGEPEKDARYLVLEDDAQLQPSWREAVEEVFANGHMPEDWHVLYLGGVLPRNESTFQLCKKRMSGRVYSMHANSWFGQTPGNRYFHFTTLAYLLSRKGARRVLQCIEATNGVAFQADFLLGYVPPKHFPVRLNHYCIDPLVARSYQYVEAGYVRPYSPEEEQGTRDSDIWDEESSFDPVFARDFFSDKDPLDIPQALHDARRSNSVAFPSPPGQTPG